MHRLLRRGQAAVYVALTFMVIALMVALATNMGIAVNDRIRMQSTVDLSTYAVAYSEAATLNRLTELNQEIADVAEDCRENLTGTSGEKIWNTDPCACTTTDSGAEMVIEMCKMELDDAIIRFTMAAEYSQSVEPALAAGRATARKNFSGTEAFTTFFEDVVGSPTAQCTYTTNYSLNSSGAGGPICSIANYEQVSDTLYNYRFMVECNPYCTPVPFITVPVSMSTWFYKDSRDPDIWVAGRSGGTPKKRYLDTKYGSSGKDGGYFGASSTGGDDTLYTYAVAKPYDGSVGPSELGGIQQNGNMMGPGVYIKQGITYPKLSMYDEYRARLAGIQDPLEGDTTPRDLIEQDGGTLGRSWDMDLFKH